MKTILGTGIFNYDIIFNREYPKGYEHNRTFTETLVKEEAGGTCGNVMCMLAYMGWKTYPLTKLDTTKEGMKMTESLKAFGCDCRFVSNTEDGGTTFLTIRNGLDKNGNQQKRVMHGSLGGDSRFPRRRFL